MDKGDQRTHRCLTLHRPLSHCVLSVTTVRTGARALLLLLVPLPHFTPNSHHNQRNTPHEQRSSASTHMQRHDTTRGATTKGPWREGAERKGGKATKTFCLHARRPSSDCSASAVLLLLLLFFFFFFFFFCFFFFCVAVVFSVVLGCLSCVVLAACVLLCVVCCSQCALLPVHARSDGQLPSCDLSPVRVGQASWPNGLFGKNFTSGASSGIMPSVDWTRHSRCHNTRTPLAHQWMPNGDAAPAERPRCVPWIQSSQQPCALAVNNI